MEINWEWLVNTAAVAGTAMVALYRIKRLEAEVALLTKALKGEGESTGIAGRMQSVEQQQKANDREMKAVWDRINGRNSGSGSHKPLSDSGD